MYILVEIFKIFIKRKIDINKLDINLFFICGILSNYLINVELQIPHLYAAGKKLAT